MHLNRAALKIFATICALTVGLAFNPSPTAAKGTIVIHRYNGTVDTYKNVSIKALHGALFATSGDGKGTVVFHRAACSYQGKLLVCFTTSATLVQAGKTQPIDLKTGTMYYNETDEPQALVFSSAKIPPHSIILSVSTKRGTYVSMSGRVDQVVK